MATCFGFYYDILIQHSGMDHIKLIACQAYSINLYRNIKTKIMKCCANIYFNKPKHVAIYIQ